MNSLKIVALKSTSILISKWVKQNRIDLWIVMGLMVAIAISVHLSTYQIPDPVFTDFYAQDVWFGSDIPTVFGNITSINSDFGRNNKHPLFPLLVFPLVFALSKILSLDPLSAVRLLIVFVSMFWVGSLYALFRIMGCYRLDATLFSFLGVVSAASIFWLAIPESFSFGSVTILLGLIFVALTQYRPFSFGWYVAVNFLTVSVTITNAMVGIFATVVNHRWQKIIQIGILALLISTGLWILQRVVFTNSGFPFQPDTFIGEKKFISVPAEGGLVAVFSSFFYQTMVMPAVELLDFPLRPDWIRLGTNTLSPASGGFWGIVAIIAWTGLLSLGVWGFFSTRQHLKLRIVLGLTLIAQLAMHSIYGVEETFIYSLHFVPLLLVLAAFSLFTHFRLVSLILATILIISAGTNNRTQFNSVTAALWDYGTPQQQVMAQMKLRPNDPWPRSAGHVILASPGSPAESKAFYEPGGSFSPQPGSFGVSIWAVDQQGNLKATSDDIPLSDIQQEFIDEIDQSTSGQSTSGILTKTPFYQTAWSMLGSDSWRLNLKPIVSATTKLSVVIRSVGPAGGAISSLDWDGQRLLISDRWAVKNIPETANVYLGSELTPNWVNDKSTHSHWKDPMGWAYAKIVFGQGDNWELEFEDNQTTTASDTGFSESLSTELVLDLPDPQFVDSLTAQISHLKMGLVGDRTHPTDPISYPLTRFRDGAYQMVALAQAGQLDIAKRLSTYFAENDFTNGSVPEVDIPALGIWALEQVASQLSQPEYDQWLWPHVQRKARLIGNMLSSNRPGYPVFSSAEFPYFENPDFLKVDLIAGKMDNQPGSISLNASANAISYRALLDAAALADRTNHSGDAAAWRSQAEQLKTVWQKLNIVDSLALVSGLWPSWMAADGQPAMAQVLQEKWEQYSDLAGSFKPGSQSLNTVISEAHQWLFLKQTDKVWAVLEWLWEHQSSPGLYAWEERYDKPGELPMPQSFSQWHRLRGRVNSSQITLRYWTAAEIALLQLNMLAYLNQGESTPTLVIGAGIPEEWVNRPMRVEGLLVEGRLMNWQWDGKRMNVQIRGEKALVNLSQSFPKTATLNVELLEKPELTIN